MNDEPPVTLTVVESGTNWNVILSFNYDPPQVAYVLAFHTSLDAALDAAYAYLYSSHATNLYARPKNSFRLALPNKSQVKHTNVALSDEAWEWFTEQTRAHKYNGRASYLGMGSFILALLAANPSPDDWHDNRANVEPDLPELNDERVNNNQLPLWSDDEFNDNLNPFGRRRTGRTMPTAKLDLILTKLEPIAVAHRLTPTYEKRDLLKRRRWASAALEAIGLQYLVPRNPPIPNPVPPKRDRRHHNDAAKSDRYFPFF
jgi:hypothetical protein